jgi:excisionase family DNA binding protein
MEQSIIIHVSPDVLRGIISKAVEEGMRAERSFRSNEMLTVRNVALECNVTMPTVYNWIKNDILKGEKIGSRTLIARSELERAKKDKGILRIVKP